MLCLRESKEVDLLVPILLDALPYEERLRRELSDPDLTVYAAWLGKELVGAAAVRWDTTGEIVLLAVDANKRGQGHGTAIVSAVIEDARHKRVDTMLVATASFSVDNIIFYQKCGFRMSHVRRDFFRANYPEVEPIVWCGITLRDMIVLDYPII